LRVLTKERLDAMRLIQRSLDEDNEIKRLPSFASTALAADTSTPLNSDLPPPAPPHQQVAATHAALPIPPPDAPDDPIADSDTIDEEDADEILRDD
jgi:hypothetical protein